MELNGFQIKSPELLAECFLPFPQVWEQMKSGLYQDFLRRYLLNDAKSKVLSSIILELSSAVLGGRYPEQLPNIDDNTKNLCSEFINRNQEAINSLQAAATRLDQQWLLYLCILMHIQGKQRLMTPETRDFILSLLEKQVFHDTSQKHITYSRRLCLIRGVPYHLNSGGQLVTLKGNVIHPLAKNAPTLVGVAWTERLGILGLCSDGKVIQRGGQIPVFVPKGTLATDISACLSHYAILDEDGSIHTNLQMDMSQWTNLEHVYVGINCAAGVIRGSGAIVTAGITIPQKYAGASEVRICHSSVERYFILFPDGHAVDDEGVNYHNISAIELGADAYFYATTSGEIYRRGFHAAPMLLKTTESSVQEILFADGQVFFD